jgi:hypothetical protein
VFKSGALTMYSVKFEIDDAAGHYANDGSEPTFYCETPEQVRAFVPGWHASTEEDPPLDEQLVKLADALIATAGPAAWTRLLDRIETLCARCAECDGELDESGICPACYEQALEDADVNRHVALAKEAS